MDQHQQDIIEYNIKINNGHGLFPKDIAKEFQDEVHWVTISAYQKLDSIREFQEIK